MAGVVLGPAAFWSLLEIQYPRPHSKHTDANVCFYKGPQVLTTHTHVCEALSPILSTQHCVALRSTKHAHCPAPDIVPHSSGSLSLSCPRVCHFSVTQFFLVFFFKPEITL